MRGAAENEIAAALLPDDDPTFAAQMFAPDFAFTRKPCLAMECAPTLQDDEQDDESDGATDQRTELQPQMKKRLAAGIPEQGKKGSASGSERVCQNVYIKVGADAFKKKKPTQNKLHNP